MFKQGKLTTEEKVNVISELRLTYPLKILLQTLVLVKSIYYCSLSKPDNGDKKGTANKIEEIFFKHKER